MHRRREITSDEVLSFISSIFGIAYIFIDERGQILNVGHGADQIIGLSKEELLAKNWQEFLPAESRSIFYVSNAYSVKLKVKNKEKWIEVYPHAMPHLHGQVIFVNEILAQYKHKEKTLLSKTEHLTQEKKLIEKQGHQIFQKQIMITSLLEMSHKLSGLIYLEDIKQACFSYLKEFLGGREVLMLVKKAEVHVSIGEMGIGKDVFATLNSEVIKAVEGERKGFFSNPYLQEASAVFEDILTLEKNPRIKNAQGKLPKLCLPLCVDNKYLGMLILFKFNEKKENSLTSSDFEVLKSLSLFVAKAVQGAMQVEEIEESKKMIVEQTLQIERRKFELEILYDVSNAISYSLNFNQVVRYVMNALKRIIPYDVCSLIIEGQDANLEFTMHMNVLLSPQAQTEIKSTLCVLLEKYVKKPIQPDDVLSNIEISESIKTDESFNEGEIQSFFNVPLQSQNKIVGLLNIASFKKDVFNKEDLLLLNTMASEVSSAFQRMRVIIAAERNKMEMMAGGIPDGLCLIDENNEIAVMNPPLKKIFRKGGAQKKLTYSFLVGQLGIDPLSLLKKEKTAELRREVELYQVPYQLVASRIIGEAHREIGTVLSFRENSAEKEIDKMKSEFVSIVSHELRTPITTMKAAISLFQDNVVSEEQKPVILDRMDKNLTRLTRVINDLLDLSKIEAGRMPLRVKDTDIEKTLQHVIESVSSKAKEKGILLKTQIPKGLPLVFVDPDKLEQIFMNLIFNAIKFTDKGEICILANGKDSEFVEVCVKDTGCGLSSEDQTHLFEKFKQAENTLTRSKGGTGLGLPIVKNLIESHGGKIWVESDIDKGASFYFRLPLSKAKSILVVDDEADFLDLLSEQLKRQGYNVLKANSGYQALEQCKKNQPDFIVSDIQMPGLSGLDLARELKKNEATSTIPLVFMTAQADKIKLLSKEEQKAYKILDKLKLKEDLPKMLDEEIKECEYIIYTQKIAM